MNVTKPLGRRKLEIPSGGHPLSLTGLLSFIEHVEQKVLFDTGTGNKRRLIHVQAVFEKVGPEVCGSLIVLHILTGCETTSEFVRAEQDRSYEGFKETSITVHKCFKENGEF